MWENIYNEIGKLRIIPVVVLDNANHASLVAKALKDGGLPCAEITFRTEAAEEAIKTISDMFPDILVGAGTVLNIGQAERAIAGGAKFIVSPGFSKEVVGYCIKRNVPIIPGCATPTEIEMAISMGIEVIKFFPAEALGGTKMLKAVSAPYHQIKFIPTGGISRENISDYLKLKQVLCCGGSWMVSRELIKKGEFEKITELTQETMEKIRLI